MNFAGDIDDFTLPLMAWLWHNQPDLLLNPEKNRNIKFTTLINNDDTADILFLKCRCARVKVTLDANGIPCAEHLPELKPRIPSADGDWSAIFEDVTWEADAHMSNDLFRELDQVFSDILAGTSQAGRCSHRSRGWSGTAKEPATAH